MISYSFSETETDENARIRHIYNIRFAAPLLRSAPYQKNENNNQLIRQVGLLRRTERREWRTIEINRSEIRASRVSGVGTRDFYGFLKYRLFFANIFGG